MIGFRRYQHLALILMSLVGVLATAEPQFVRFDAEVCHRPQDATAWGVSEEQLNALCNASLFTATLLRKGSQFIVLVGEAHFTNARGVQEVKAILPLFRFRGLEGLSDPAFKATTPEGIEDIEKFLRRQLTKIGFSFESLIKHSQGDGLFLEAGKVPLINGASAGKDFSQAVIAMNTSNPADAWSNLKYFKRRVYSKFRSGLPEMPLNIRLEADQNSIINHAKFMCGKNKNCPDSVIIDYRNALMIETVREIFEQLPEEGPLLVVVGSKHVPGLVHSLVCREGFEHHTVSKRGSFNFRSSLSQIFQNDDADEFFEFSPYNCQNE